MQEVNQSSETPTTSSTCTVEAPVEAEPGKLLPSGLHWPGIEPWPDPVDGAALLNDIVATLCRFAVLPRWAPQAVALWIVHTFAFHLRTITTYLGIESPEKRCGKTTLLKILTKIVNRPVVASNVSSSAFFRVIAEAKPTFIIDEADTILFGNDELRGILNSGYTLETAFVVRVANQPKPAKTAKTSPTTTLSQLALFSSWCPKAIASIGHLPDTLADRCILVRMHRKTAAEKCERLRSLNALDTQRRCLRFVLDHSQQIAAAEPPFPPDLNDRAVEIWEPLFAIADLAGSEWPSLARQAALSLTLSAQETNPIASLLLDLAFAFADNNCDRLFSRSIIDFLEHRPDRPWADLRKSKALNQHWLAHLLRPYGVRPKTIWIGDVHAKGYLREDFTDIFKRYIPRSEVDSFFSEFRNASSPAAAPETSAPPAPPAPANSTNAPSPVQPSAPIEDRPPGT